MNDFEKVDAYVANLDDASGMPELVGQWRTTNDRPITRRPGHVEQHGCGCVTGWDDVHEACILTRCADHARTATRQGRRCVVAELPSTTDLDRWRQLCDDATPGPWSVEIEGGVWESGESWSTIEVSFDGAHDLLPGDQKFAMAPGLAMGDHASNQADAEFIAEARTAMPALIDAVSELRGSELIGEALGYLWMNAPARRTEIEAFLRAYDMQMVIDR